MKEKFTFFWQTGSPFSQWHPAIFTVDGKQFNCSEQYMMYGKAVLFGDDEMATKILEARSPRQQKALGRKVQHFVESVWDEASWEIVMTGNRAKFTQNKTLRQALLETAGTTLVEASPYDCIWGIGLAKGDARAKDRKQWRGENRLGEILTRLREELIAEGK